MPWHIDKPFLDPQTECFYMSMVLCKSLTRNSIDCVDQIGTSVRFWPKKGNAETLKAIVSKTAPLATLPPGGFLFIHEI